MTQGEPTEPISVRYYCTRPECIRPENSLSGEEINNLLRNRRQVYCHNCRFPLLLEGDLNYRYLAFKQLDRGGFSRTFLAQQISPNGDYLPENIVLKLFCPSRHLSQQQFINAERAFEREAKILLRLAREGHHIPRLLDFLKLENPPVSNPNAFLDQSNNHQELFYIVQEYIPGQNLQQALEERRRGLFSEDEVFYFLKELLKTLKLVHKADIIHRDLKPSNIIYNSRRFYLIDFGNVKEITLGQETNINGYTVCFTPGYAPPEQRPGGKVNEATDLYALGATAVYLLTGERPPSERQSERDDDYNRWLLRSQEYSLKLYPVLNKMLSYNSNRRYSSAQEVINALERPNLSRRDYLIASAGLAVGGVSGFGSSFLIHPRQQNQTSSVQPSVVQPSKKVIEWKMATSWSPDLHPTIYQGAKQICDLVKEMTDKQFIIELDPTKNNYGVSPKDILYAVKRKEIECGHTASYYYCYNQDTRYQTLAFGTTVPFGLNARQQNAWLYEGGGLELMRYIYEKLQLDVIQFPAGNTGGQMGGWFKSKIKSIEDLNYHNTKFSMRIATGLGADVMQEMGAYINRDLMGKDMVNALRENKLKAAEWIGPYDDMQLELHKAVKPSEHLFYYYPGWWEPATTFELQVNKTKWNSLSNSYKQILEAACAKVNIQMLAKYDALNRNKIAELKKPEYSKYIQLNKFDDMILSKAKEIAFDKYQILADNNQDTFKLVYENWKEFRKSLYLWHEYTEISLDSYNLSDIKNKNR